MGTEIERKFLVRDSSWRQGLVGTPVRQGYLSAEEKCSVRIRLIGHNAFLTIKGKGTGFSRSEFEYAVPATDANQMLDTLCVGLVEKVRYTLRHDGHLWEIDVFDGANAGLTVAEIELDAEDEKFAHPPWLGAEVTHDPRYLNARLAKEPYMSWKR